MSKNMFLDHVNTHYCVFDQNQEPPHPNQERAVPNQDWPWRIPIEQICMWRNTAGSFFLLLKESPGGHYPFIETCCIALKPWVGQMKYMHINIPLFVFTEKWKRSGLLRAFNKRLTVAGFILLYTRSESGLKSTPPPPAPYLFLAHVLHPTPGGGDYWLAFS